MSRRDCCATHLQGAAFWDWMQDGVDASAQVPVQLDIDPDSFALTAAEKGIANDKAVVCYDGGAAGSMFACRVRWALRCHGHRRAFVLEGGWKAWLHGGGEVSLHEPCPLSVRRSLCWSQHACSLPAARPSHVRNTHAPSAGDNVGMLHI